MAEAVSGPTGPTPPVPNRLVVPLQEGGQQQPQGKSNLDSIVASVMGVLGKKKVGSDELLRSQIDNLLDYTSGKKKGKFAEDDEKNRKGWRKWLYGGWQAAGKALGAIERGVKKLASSGLMSFLVGLALLSMFDPEGTFIISLIDMLTNLFLMLINIFISLIPKMINFLMVAVPKIAKALGEAFLKILSVMFKSLGESNSFLEFVLKLVFFGAIIAKIVMSLSFLFPILAAVMTPVGIIALLIVGAFLGLAYSFQQAYKKSQAVRDAVSSVFEMLKEKVRGLWESVKRFWDRITGAFTRIKEALFGKDEGNQESFWVKVVEGVGAALGFIIDALSWAIENLLGPAIDIITSIIVIFIKVFKVAFPYIKMIGKAVWDIIRPAFIAIGEIFSGVAKFFKELSEVRSFADLKDVLKNAIAGAFTWLADRLRNLFGEVIAAIRRNLPSWMGGYSAERSEASLLGIEVISKKLDIGDVSQDDYIELLKGLAKSEKGKLDFEKDSYLKDFMRGISEKDRANVKVMVQTMSEELGGKGELSDKEMLEYTKLLAENSVAMKKELEKKGKPVDKEVYRVLKKFKKE